MTINGQLTQSITISQAEAVGGITFSGNPAISAEAQVRAPEFTKAWHWAGTIDAPTTFDVFGLLATASGVLTFGAPSDGSTVIVTGPDGGPYTFTKVAATPAANEFTAIAELTALLDAIDGLAATDDGTDITLTVTTAGEAANAWTVTGTSSYSALNITFSGGADSDLQTPFGDPVNFESIQAIAIKNESAAESVTAGGGSDPLLAALPAITPGGAVQLYVEIPASESACNLLLTPTDALDVQVLILGT